MEILVFFICTVAEGTVQVSTSAEAKVTLGFKPSVLIVMFYTDINHYRLLEYDVNMNSTAGLYCTRISSSSSRETYYRTFPSTETGSIASIDNDGFTLCKISSGQSSATPTTGRYIAIP